MKTLSELELTLQQADKFVLKYHCGDCGANLSVAWGGAFGIKEYVVRCGNDKSHTKFGKNKSLEQIMEEKMANEKYGPQSGKRELIKISTPIQPLMNKLAITQDEGIIILKSLWNDAPDLVVKQTAAYCAMYRLNPLKKHVALMKFWNKKTKQYDWVMHEGIDATRLQVARKHKFSYLEGPRVMKEAEQIETFGEAKPGEIVVFVLIKDLDTGGQAPGIGSWAKEKYFYDEELKKYVSSPNIPHGTDKGNSAFNMASIHAERHAFRRLFPADLPESVPVFDERYEDLPQGTAIESTGEIIPPAGQIEEHKDPAVNVQPEQTTTPGAGSQSEAPEPFAATIHGQKLWSALKAVDISQEVFKTEILKPVYNAEMVVGVLTVKQVQELVERLELCKSEKLTGMAAIAELKKLGIS